MPRRREHYLGLATIVLVRNARLDRHEGLLELEQDLEIEEVMNHRNEECPYYEECLRYAAALHWRSFSCILCEGNANLDEDLVPPRDYNVYEDFDDEDEYDEEEEEEEEEDEEYDVYDVYDVYEEDEH